MSKPITVVSGLPRSGTSMMMKMLQAGGMELLTDEIRTADEDNPKGYFELERVKQLKDDRAWLEDAGGKVVKVISQLLFDLPDTHRYGVVFMRRRIDEVLASQRQMLIRRGTYKPDVKDEALRSMFLKHVEKVAAWLEEQGNFDVLYINYNEMLQDPVEKVNALSRFLGDGLDTDAMARVVDPSLYRQRV
jgi:LPS sulfotransferase NodH